MVIYHLVGHVHTNNYGELCEAGCYFSDVFSTMELAVNAGKREVKERIDRLFKDQRVFEEEELDDFIEECINYILCVYEFDPLREHERLMRTDFENISFENSIEFSTKIQWEYDHKGELLIRTEWRNSGFEIYAGDYEEDAGTHFKKGDLVTLKPSKRQIASGVCVVTGVPGRRKDAKNPFYWENIYTLHYLNKDDEYSQCHDHQHESQLEPFMGKLPADSFLYVLSEIFKGERKVSDEIMDRLYWGEKIYAGDIKCHYKFIDGLQPREKF